MPQRAALVVTLAMSVHWLGNSCSWAQQGGVFTPATTFYVPRPVSAPATTWYVPQAMSAPGANWYVPQQRFTPSTPVYVPQQMLLTPRFYATPPPVDAYETPSVSPVSAEEVLSTDNLQSDDDSSADQEFDVADDDSADDDPLPVDADDLPDLSEDDDDIAPLLDYSRDLAWVRTDFLMWRLPDNDYPALLTSGPTVVLEGAIDSGYRPGFDVAVGTWLNHEFDLGWEVEWIHLDNVSDDSTRFSSDGTPVLARPVQNLTTGLPDSVLVATAAAPQLSGTFQTQTDSEFHSVSLSCLKYLYTDSLFGSDCRVNLTGGYRFLRFRENFLMTDQTTGPRLLGPVGRVQESFDRFQAENDFHGVDIGFTGQCDLGRCTLDLSAKIATGNVRQTIIIDGGTTVRDPATPPVSAVGGILARPSNIGTRIRDHWTAIPEFAMDLRFHLTPSVSLNLQYHVLALINGVRSSDHVNTTVMPAQFTGFNETVIWAQGIGVGAAVTF